MLRRPRTLLILWLLACPVATHGQSGAGDGTQAGWIEQISCAAQWRHRPELNARALNRNKDQYRFLYLGDEISCKGKDTLTLQVYEDRMRIDASNGWCTIEDTSAKCERGVPTIVPPDDRTPPKQLTEQRGHTSAADRQAIADFGRTAGRSRGPASAIISPANDSVLRVDGLAIRWTAAATAAVQLRLMDQDDRVLWMSDAIDARAGTVDAQPARRAMNTFRRAGGNGDLTLALDAGAAFNTMVHFALLSEAEEQNLDTELAGCDAKHGFLRTVCRVYQFSMRQMWNAATEEYERALTASPQSEDLLRAALAANQRIGDMDRAKQLSTQLLQNSREKR